MTASLSSAPRSFSRLFYDNKFRPKRTGDVHIEKGRFSTFLHIFIFFYKKYENMKLFFNQFVLLV